MEDTVMKPSLLGLIGSLMPIEGTVLNVNYGNNEFMEKLTRLHPIVEFKEFDVAPYTSILPYPDHSIDLVMAYRVFHRLDILDECCRVAKSTVIFVELALVSRKTWEQRLEENGLFVHPSQRVGWFDYLFHATIKKENR